jgi:threonine synthase
LGDKLMLRILRESGGGAVAVTDEVMAELAATGTRAEGVDWSPEGGAALAAAVMLRDRGEIAASDRVVVFNTGAGWLYRTPEDLLGPIV